MKTKSTQYIALAVMFVLMCILRLWTSIFIVFIFGFVLTVLTRKKTFCAGYCPMGALQDMASDRKMRRSIKLPKIVKWLIAIAFWGIIAASVLMNAGDPYLIWWSLFRFTVLIAAFALVLQLFFANRTWCTAFCPMGSIYTQMVRSYRNR